jgi:hypothetical protein
MLASTPTRKRWAVTAAFILLAACGAGEPPTPNTAEATTEKLSEPAPAPRLTAEEEKLLQSEPLRAAIHRALTTGANQRWADGPLSGYAVPSLSVAANGCRAVRYTVDQRPASDYRPINACEGSRPAA